FIPLSWLMARSALDYEGPAGWPYALLGSVAGVLVLGGVPALWLYLVVAKRHVNRILRPMGQDLAEAEALVSQCQERAAMSYHSQLGEAKRKCDKDLREATEKHQRHKTEIKERHEREIQETMEKYRRLRAELKERRDNDLKQADQKHQRVRAEIDEQ